MSNTLYSELLSYFIEEQTNSSSKSPSTIRNIERDIQKFLEWLADNEINEENIKNYLDYLKEEHMESSFVSKVSSLRQFVNWLNLAHNPFWNIKLAINHDDWILYSSEHISSTLDGDWDIAKLIIGLIYDGYLTLDEAADLKLSNFNTVSGEIYIRETNLGLSPRTKELLSFYLKHIRVSYSNNQVLNLNDPLLISASNKALSKADINQLVNAQDIMLRYLKRSRIVHLLESGLSHEEISTLLNIRIQNTYKADIPEPEFRLLKAYRDFHPRAGL